MLSRERVLAAINFETPDIVPVEYHASPAGFVDHGEKLGALWNEYTDDFGPRDRFKIPNVDPGPRTWRDAWGVQWTEQSFGAGGLPVEHPLKDWDALRTLKELAQDGLAAGGQIRRVYHSFGAARSGLCAFKAPPLPAACGPAFEAEKCRAARYREQYFLKSAWISLFELMHALRSFEDVLVDIATGSVEVGNLAGRLTAHHAAHIDYLLARGVDAIQFGDDFGTQTELIISPKMWRRFFRPRYEFLIQRIKRAGASFFFHTCGHVRGLLDDITALGVDAIWPQLNTYDLPWLASYCRKSKMAVALHPDRGDLMIRSSPEQVSSYVKRLAEIFEVDRGGAWFYIEVDRGFPFDNVAALTRTVAQLRSRAHQT